MPRLLPAATLSSLAFLTSSTLCACGTTRYVAAPPEDPVRPPAALLQKPTPIHYKDEFKQALTDWLGLSADASPSTTNSSP